jgi:hypothetical protein
MSWVFQVVDQSFGAIERAFPKLAATLAVPRSAREVSN